MIEKKKTILIITLSLSEKNGLGRYSNSLARRLAENYHLQIFTGREDQDYQPIPNAEIYHILPGLFDFYKLKNPLVMLRGFLSIVRRAKRVDFVHSFMDFPYSFLGFFSAKFYGKPFFLTAHGTYSIQPFMSRPGKYFHALALRSAAKIFCISGYTEKELKKRIKLDNTVVINNGIDFNKFYSNQLMPKSLNPQILGVGILKERKGFHISIPAMAEVKKYYPNLKYFIVGYQENKEYYKTLKSLVEKFDLVNNIIFLEKLSDEELKKLYQTSNLFLLTSINTDNNFEGFGLVYLEAGASGLPVIGTLGCGAEDAIDEARTGFLVPQKDIKATAQAILKIFNNPELALKLGEAGIAKARTNDWGLVVKKYIDVYRSFNL